MWKYYNHALINDFAPNEEISQSDLDLLKDRKFWKSKNWDGATPLFARYTTNFDCGFETEFWYVIKDTSFDISSLNAKRRYNITKGKQFFECKIIDPSEFTEQIYNVAVAAFSAYPKKYRPNVDHDSFIKDVLNWHLKFTVIGGFFKETNELCGYAVISSHGSWLSFDILKTNPSFEKYNINAAIVYQILTEFNSELAEGKYLCNGTRSINHETKFNDYLERLFEFRKAYCKLNIVYNPKYKCLIKCLYVFRKLLKKFDNIGIVHNLNSVLKMEEIVRSQNIE
jgi:hypothetical protein